MANVVQYILDIESKEAVKGMKKVSKEADKTEDQFDKTKKSGLEMASQVGSAVTGLASGIGIVTGGIQAMIGVLTSAVEASYEFSKSVVDSVNQLNDLEARSGLTAESIQAIIMAFEGSGQSAEKAEGFISRFPRLFADLATGSGRAADAARALGIEFTDSVTGKMKSADTILKDVTRSLQAIESDSERATMGFLLLGRGAGDFLQAFGKTSDFENFVDFTREFGVKTGPEASLAAARFQESISLLKTATKGLSQRFSDAIGGVSLFQKGLKSAIAFVVGLQVVIEENHDVFRAFGNNVIAIGSALGSFFKQTAVTIAEFVQTTVSFLLLQLNKPLFLLNMVGAISDEAFESILKGSDATVAALGNIRDIVVELTEMDIEDSDSVIGQRVQEAMEKLDNILAGITIESLEAGKALNAFREEEEKTKKSTIKLTDEQKQFRKDLSSYRDLIERTSEAFATMDMTKAEREIHNLDKTISELEKAMKFFDEEAGFEGLFQVEEILRLIAIAEQKRTDILKEQNKVVVESVDALGIMTTGFQTLIQGVASPEAFIQAIPDLMGQAPEIAKLIGGKATGAEIAAAGPHAAALAGATLGIAKLGAMTKEALAKLPDQFDSFINNFEKGIDILPRIIKDILPEFIVQFAKVISVDFMKLLLWDLPIAIIAALPELINQILIELVLLIADIFKGTVEIVRDIKHFVQTISTKEGWRMIAQQITIAIKDQFDANMRFLGDAFDVSKRSGGRYIPSARGGIRFTGSEDGLAMLHRGEYVVPESNVMSQAVNRRLDQSSGSGINVIINADIVEGSAVDSLVRKIEERFGSFGASTSTLFGGA